MTQEIKPKVYVAGPYTQGDVAVNVRRAIDYGDALMEHGYIPYIPHLSHFWHMLTPREYYDWVQYDNIWVLECDVLVRLKGTSHGADKEVDLAISAGMSVITAPETMFAPETKERLCKAAIQRRARKVRNCTPQEALRLLSAAISTWSHYNFPKQDCADPLIGMYEEAGELSHAFLKNKQGIRGSTEQHYLDMADAVGDIVVYLIDFCNRNDLDFANCIFDAWHQVSKRDWQKYPKDGLKE